MTTPSQTFPPRSKSRQRGAAIIIMALILMLGLVTLFTFRMDRRGPELDADRKTAMALAQAKEALLGRAAADGNRPGSLGCPDVNNDGLLTMLVDFQAGTGACTSALGRVPWVTLDIGDAVDGASEHPWYLLSANFFDVNGAQINTATPGTLTVKNSSGSIIQANVVAIVIAPGAPVVGQNRLLLAQGNLANYLEGYKIADPTAFTIELKSPTYNDRILTITTQEMFSVVALRMARELANHWNTPPGNYFPPPATSSIAVVPVPTIWSSNNWNVPPAVTVSNSTAAAFTMSFANCSVGYTISIDNTYRVTRSGQC